MDRLTVELSALGFQAAVTALLAAVYLGLWRSQRRRWFATWAAGWTLYAVRLVLISAFLLDRREIWLFAHQAVTGLTALLLLAAALQFSQGLVWRRWHAGLALLSVAWAAVAIYVIRDLGVAGISAAAFLSAVTLWTGVVFWRHRRRSPSVSATGLAVTFTLWGLHHLDYPLLRSAGTGVLYGVFADVLLITVAAIGTLFLVLGDGRRALEARRTELEQLTALLLRAQEEERKRIARELHDEAGQVLTAVKIELDLEGRAEASRMVARALDQVRDLSNLLRPSVLDDLGLLPALRALVEDFRRRTRIDASFEAPERIGPLPPDQEVAIYRVVQEALTNVARHAKAGAVSVALRESDGGVTLAIEDDGRALHAAPEPHLGLLGMRERVHALGGTLAFSASPGEGFRIEASLPAAR
ncbi:MAG TPA: sensor histidine kinase [Planctomycetota bacterium]|nr:sensor histidine kinase [Planctomycetota bacterium]